jgi:hypothetical protein
MRGEGPRGSLCAVTSRAVGSRGVQPPLADDLIRIRPCNRKGTGLQGAGAFERSRMGSKWPSERLGENHPTLQATGQPSFSLRTLDPSLIRDRVWLK